MIHYVLRYWPTLTETFVHDEIAAVAARAPALDPFGQRGGQRPQVLGGDVDAADAAVEGVVGDVLFLKRER